MRKLSVKQKALLRVASQRGAIYWDDLTNNEIEILTWENDFETIEQDAQRYLLDIDAKKQHGK